MEQQLLFEVVKADGLRTCIPLDEISCIHETRNGSILAVAGTDDVETNEEYELMKIRFERFLIESRRCEHEDFDRRWDLKQKK